MPLLRSARLFAACALAWSFCSSASADSFPPITDAERSLAAVPFAPKASAVVLSREAELRMMGYGVGSQSSSSLKVHTRIKILTEDGKKHGQIKIDHSSFARLQNIEGRTVLSDGRTLPLTAEAKFERLVSQREKRSVTSVAFPGVEVGAILDLSYEIRFDTFLYLEPWYFSDRAMPVLHSEIVYEVPKGITLQGGSVDPFKVNVQSAQEVTLFGAKLRIWADRLPEVPEEPFALPFADLATRVLILPLAKEGRPLLTSWEDVTTRSREIYDEAQKKDRGVKETARRIAATAGSGGRAQAQTLYRFVRDEIAADEDDRRIWPHSGSTVAETLDRKHGDSADKALLLQALLREMKLDARLVWAGDRRRGEINVKLVNPISFDRVLVAVDLAGERIFLDPADRNLGFGALSPWYEGTPAVLADPPKTPGVITLPASTAADNGRQVALDLSLDGGGRLAGTGTLTLTGQHAWREIHPAGSAAETADSWKEWLAGRFKDFRIADVKVEESVDERRVRLTWSLAERDEAVLGDESTLAASRPLGPVSQPFVQPAAARQSPVVLSFAGTDEVELRLHWPEGWRIDAKPEPVRIENPVGALTVSLDAEAAGRTLTYHRRLEIRRKELGTVPEIEAVRSLFAAAEKSDAQALSLVRH
ncbi:MAG TPA: DUF3857 domain-containing protein [Thermoanaerobaculia bacterium]|jgi:hypothetical protein|nr:DUF3857 domain-containing protein [Thermoanaerobaculia bacterium]